MNAFRTALAGGAQPLLATSVGALAEWAVRSGTLLASWFATHKVKGFLAVTAIACSIVAAQSGGVDGSPQVQTQTMTNYDFTPESTIRLISDAVDDALKSLERNAKLKAYGSLISGFFLILLLTWSGIKTMAAGKGLGELFGEWVPVFVSFGVVYLLLDKGAGAMIVSMMDGITTAVSGLDMSSLNGAITTGALPIFKAISAVVGQPRVTEGAQVSSIGGALGFLSTIGAGLASILMGAITKIVAIVVLVLAGVTMLAHIIMGFMSVRLVLALAPVMVPFLMFRPLGWIFDGWLRFLIGACMLKVVIAFMLVMVGGLLGGMSNMAERIYQESWRVQGIETLYVDILMYGMMMVFAILASLMIHQAPSIASGLVSGGGATGFSGIRALTQSSGGRIASSAGSEALTSAGGAAAKGGSFSRGFLHATSPGPKKADGSRGPAVKDNAYRTPQRAADYGSGFRSGQAVQAKLNSLKPKEP
jgi:type IV secretion system protein TrbL